MKDVGSCVFLARNEDVYHDGGGREPISAEPSQLCLSVSVELLSMSRCFVAPPALEENHVGSKNAAFSDIPEDSGFRSYKAYFASRWPLQQPNHLQIVTIIF
jgi:hypothetical protein